MHSLLSTHRISTSPISLPFHAQERHIRRPLNARSKLFNEVMISNRSNTYFAPSLASSKPHEDNQAVRGASRIQGGENKSSNTINPNSSITQIRLSRRRSEGDMSGAVDRRRRTVTKSTEHYTCKLQQKMARKAPL